MGKRVDMRLCYRRKSASLRQSKSLDRIAGLLGGRVAEEIVLGEVSTGAHNDFQKVTSIARAMVTEYGMSENLGAMQFGSSQGGNVFLGRDFNSDQNYSDSIAYEIDKEMQKIIDTQYERTKRILTEKRHLLDLIANTLMEKETLNAQEIEHLRDHGVLPEPEAAEKIEENTPKIEAKPTLDTIGEPVVEKELLSKESNPTTLDLAKERKEPNDAPKGIDEKRD